MSPPRHYVAATTLVALSVLTGAARAEQPCASPTAVTVETTGHRQLARRLDRQVSDAPRKAPTSPWVRHDGMTAKSLWTVSPSFRGRIPPAEHIALRYDPATGEAILVAGEHRPGSTTTNAAVARAPAWLRDRLEDRFSRLSDEQREPLAQLILDVDDPRLVDEVAFAIAAVSIDHLEDELFLPETLLVNAREIYDADPVLHYVELVDVGAADVDDDYHTTARYRMLDAEGTPVDYEIEPDLYYWYVVLPTFGRESLTLIDPVTAEPASAAEGGLFWRSYFLHQDPDPARQAVTHFGLEHPTLIDDSMVSGWGPSAQGVLTDFEVDPIPLVVDESTGEPTLVVFSYPAVYHDGTVLGTTMPLELAYRAGDTELLDNLLRLGSVGAHVPVSRRIAIVKDRDPWGEPTVEQALAALGYANVDVFPASQIGDVVQGTTQYTKLIVPSGQPRSLYQALADARPAIDAWLTRETWGVQSVFQFHGAIDLADPNDDWSDLDMPGGFSCSDQLNDGRDALAVAGFPMLLDVLTSTDHVMSWADDGHLWEGSRPLDLSSSALDLIGYFGTQNMQDRCAEVPNYYQGPDGQDQGTNLDQTLRSPYAHRSLYLHFGNCGEAQDVLGAATRAALLPNSDVNSFVDDHVWNLTYVDGRWLTWTINSSDDITGVGGNVLWKEKDWTTVIEFRGDGSISDRTAMYTKHVTLNLNVTDGAGNPVDGASVLVASPGRHDPSKLLVALLEWTDLDGHLSFDLGTARDYFIRVKSPAGLWPGPEDNKVEQVLTASQSVTPGDAFELDVTLDGPPPAIPWDVTAQAEPAPEGLALRVQADAFHHALEGDNTLYERRFNEWHDGGALDLLVLDEENYGLLLAALPFEALAHFPQEESIDALIDVAPPPAGQGLYVVASNRSRLGHSAFIDLVVTHEGEPVPPSAGNPALPDATGGCQCGTLGTGRHGGRWAVLSLLALALAWERRRRTTTE